MVSIEGSGEARARAEVGEIDKGIAPEPEKRQKRLAAMRGVIDTVLAQLAALTVPDEFASFHERKAGAWKLRRQVSDAYIAGDEAGGARLARDVDKLELEGLRELRAIGRKRSAPADEMAALDRQILYYTIEASR